MNVYRFVRDFKLLLLFHLESMHGRLVTRVEHFSALDSPVGVSSSIGEREAIPANFKRTKVFEYNSDGSYTVTSQYYETR